MFSFGAFVISALYIAWTGIDLKFRFLDGVNLLFHEAGHPVFGIFGHWIGYLGGTLGQLAFPLATSWHFLKRQEWNSVSFTLLWLASNFFNIAWYMADAQRQELPLVGGGDHDWAFLFGSLGIVSSCETIAMATRLVGFAVLCGATSLAYRQLRNPIDRVLDS